MKSILTERQQRLLKRIGEHSYFGNRFYLTGGTALAGFYLHHRYSEDLDFFSEEEFDIDPLNVFFRTLKKELGYQTIDFQQHYNRNLFFLNFKDEVLKTEFTFFPFPRIETNNKKNGLAIDSLLDLAVNKLFTIYQRSTARDYVDLYWICHEKGWSISELTKKARIKFDWHIDPLQLGAQFVKARDAKDEPRLLLSISRTDWEQFFFEEAKKLKFDIVE